MLLSTVTGGNRMTASSALSDSSLRPLCCGPSMRTCSVYVPGHTFTVSFGPEAVTAAWIDMNCAVGHCAWSSSTRYSLAIAGLAPTAIDAAATDTSSIDPDLALRSVFPFVALDVTPALLASLSRTLWCVLHPTGDDVTPILSRAGK